MPLTKIKYNNEILDSANNVLPVSISYRGTTLSTLSAGQSKTLLCANKLIGDDIVIGQKTLKTKNKFTEHNIEVSVDDLIHIQKPTMSENSYEYTGGQITLNLSGFSTDTMNRTDYAFTERGNYNCIVSLKDKGEYCWADGSQDDLIFNWSIVKRNVAIPSVATNPTYNGSSVSPTWNGYDTTWMTLISGGSGINAGSQNATFELNDKTNTNWPNGTTTNQNVSWVINKLTLTTPSASTSPTYNGSDQEPSWSNYDSSKMTKGGDYHATNAGSYNATFSAGSNWTFSGGDTVSVDWTLNKASYGTLTASETTLDWGEDGTGEKTVTIGNIPPDGVLDAPRNDNYRTSVSGNVVTINHTTKETSTKTITVSCTAPNYTVGSVSITCKATRSCVTGDSLILLANGTTKRVDELQYSDELLVWNFFEGKYEIAYPMMIMHHNDSDSYVKLTFEDNTELKIVGSHELFDCEIYNWVSINENNASEFIGHKFAKKHENGIIQVKLVNYELVNEKVSMWGIQSTRHCNVIIENMFTFTPQAFSSMYNLFKITSKYKYSEKQMENDIAIYGQYEPKDFEPYGLSETMFYLADGANFKILVGRGEMTFEDVVLLIKQYLLETTKNEFVKKV